MRFLLVDRVDSIIPGTSVSGVKNVTLSDEILQDHFPDHPLFPGTLIVEAIAQLAGFLVECSLNQPGEPRQRAVLAQIDKAKFHRPCRPGDQLRLSATLSSTVAGAAQITGEAQIDGERAAQVTLTFVMRQVDSPALNAQRQSLYRTWTQHLTLPFDLP